MLHRFRRLFLAEKTVAEWNLYGVSNTLSGSARQHSSPNMVPSPPPVNQDHRENS
ncbi:hypothetical protein LINPERPRIM_LOCUS28274, partial [Linum perenne]